MAEVSGGLKWILSASLGREQMFKKECVLQGQVRKTDSFSLGSLKVYSRDGV